MRAYWTRVHRYAGLLSALFLFISGVTGAIIAWDHELDALLNPQLMRAPAGSVFYAQAYGLYGVSFFPPGGDHGSAGVGPPVLYYDALDGRLLGQRQPWQGTAADIFLQAQFPLHSGRILGLPGRILISLMGLVVALLSVTGVLIWWRKRRARLLARRRTPHRPRMAARAVREDCSAGSPSA